jgi:Endonuclease NucS
MIGGKGRSSLVNTVALNRPYAFSALTLSMLFERDGSGLKFRSGALRKYRSFLHDYDTNHTFIEFETDQEWIAYFGDPTAQPTKELAMDLYMSKGDVQSAVALKKKEGVSKQELRQFSDMMLSETKIEDYLENNLDYIGDATGNNLTLVKRQYQTSITRIDLLTRDKSTKDYLVIELKKGRSSDKVYGQCSRYMGWVRKNLAEPEGVKVHGAIVAKSIDDKLKAARDAHDTKVSLVEFSMKAHAKVVA